MYYDNRITHSQRRSCCFGVSALCHENAFDVTQGKSKYLLERTFRCLLLGVVHRCHPAEQYQCQTKLLFLVRE